MADPLSSIMALAGSGLRAQSIRMQVAAENLANAQSTGSASGADPYQRKTVTFSSVLDSQTQANLVSVSEISRDRTPFPLEHRPGHPAADAAGYVKLPNVRPLVELADMREAGRSYEANLNVVRQARQLQSMTIDLLRNS